MSRGVNKVILVGNVGQDPEVRYLPNGGAVANVSIATSESWMDKNTNQRQDKTEWHRVVFFGKLADIVSQYVKKGSKLYVEGKLQTRKWQDQAGQDKYTTEIVVDGFTGVMQMLDGRGEGGAGQGQQGMPSSLPPQGGYGQQPQYQQAPQQQAPQYQQPAAQPQYQQAPQQAPQYQQPDYNQAAPAMQQPAQARPAPQQVPQSNFGSPASNPAQSPAPSQSFDDFDDDIPF